MLVKLFGEFYFSDSKIIQYFCKDFQNSLKHSKDVIFYILQFFIL